MCPARRLMVFNVCVKFHENMSSGSKVMERTRNLLTDRQTDRHTHTHTHTHTQREKRRYIIPPWHTSYAGGIMIYCSCSYLLNRFFDAENDYTRAPLSGAIYARGGF